MKSSIRNKCDNCYHSEADLTFESHFVSKLLETYHFTSRSSLTNQLDERIRDDIQGREETKDSASARQFWRKSYPKIVPRLSLPTELYV